MSPADEAHVADRPEAQKRIWAPERRDCVSLWRMYELYLLWQLNYVQIRKWTSIGAVQVVFPHLSQGFWGKRCEHQPGQDGSPGWETLVPGDCRGCVKVCSELGGCCQSAASDQRDYSDHCVSGWIKNHLTEELVALLLTQTAIDCVSYFGNHMTVNSY